MPFERSTPRACNSPNILQKSRAFCNALTRTMSSSGSFNTLASSFSLIQRVSMLRCALNILEISMLVIPAAVRCFKISLLTLFFLRPPVDLFPVKCFHVSVACFESSNYCLSMLLFKTAIKDISIESTVVSSSLSNYARRFSNNAAASIEFSKDLFFNSSNRDKK